MLGPDLVLPQVPPLQPAFQAGPRGPLRLPGAEPRRPGAFSLGLDPNHAAPSPPALPPLPCWPLAASTSLCFQHNR